MTISGFQQKGGEIATSLAASNVLAAGQVCTNPGVVISNDSAASSVFLNTFASYIRNTPGALMLTETISEGYKWWEEVFGPWNN